MNARCEINISEQSVNVVISRGRNELQVFIDDVEQDETKEICKFQHSKRKNVEFDYFYLFAHLSFFFPVEFEHSQKFILKPTEKTFIEHCSLPEDTVDPLNIN